MKVQFGCGLNRLEGWDNRDIETDIRKTLPFPIGSVKYILAEHVIEHVEFREGVFFLGECLRILEAGGVLRLAFPDITREIPPGEYARHAAPYMNRQFNCAEDVWLSIIIDWQHKSCWTLTMATRVLMAIGFDRPIEREYLCSPHPELDSVDGHHKSVGIALAEAETTILEASR